MNIAQALERGSRLFPDNPALIFEGESFSYRRLDELSIGVAQGLAALGIGRGDRVALMLPNSPAFVLGYFGVLKLGAVVVSINTALKSEELGFILNDSGARVLITTDELHGLATGGDGLPLLEQVLVATAGQIGGMAVMSTCPPYPATDLVPDETAALLYTSGTTGFPKGATLTHGNVVSNVRACVESFGLTPQDKVLLCLPLFHCFGQNAALNPCFEAGATLLLHRQFELEPVLRSIAEDEVTVFFGVPTLYGIVHGQATPASLRSVRRFISAAAELPARLAREWQEKFDASIGQGYGLTEACLACFNPNPSQKPASVGLPLVGIELKVLDQEGREAAPGKLGELAIRGPNVMQGYWNRPNAMAETLRDGWFHTGDIGRIDPEGYCYIVDRIKDMVNVGGMKVYPSEVETVLSRHPAVNEVAVYGVPHALLGEEVRASVVLAPNQNVEVETLLAYCGERLAEFKRPSAIEFVATLPKSPTGKILKRLLRERFERGLEEDRRPAIKPHLESPGSVSIEVWLSAWLARELAMVAPERDRPFAEYGLTSLLAVKMAGDLERWLGHSVPTVIAWYFPTVAKLADHLSREASPALRQTPSIAAAQAPEALDGLSEAELARLLAAEIRLAQSRRSR
ncbi:MAG: AMP-binding protein [Methylococcaceae bacterium]|nr:AMP-binding protein [Methylococcaceae bacterium]